MGLVGREFNSQCNFLNSCPTKLTLTPLRTFTAALAVFYIGYIIVELPSNLVLKKVGGNTWLPLITAAWGGITALTSVSRTYGGFLAIRFFLGFTEGGLLPGISLYLSFIYPRHSLQRRIAAFYAGAALAGSFGGLLATGLTRIKTGSTTGWQWLFIVEGLITMAFAGVAWLLLPKDISSSKFLKTEEKEALLAVKKHDNSSSYRSISALLAVCDGEVQGLDKDRLRQVELEQQDAEGFEWLEVRRAVTSFQTWATGLLYLCVCNSLYSFTLFLPTIVSCGCRICSVTHY